MLSHQNEYKRRKGAASCLRFLYNGTELLREGTFTLRIVDTEIGNVVKAAKGGYLTAEEVLLIAADLRKKFEAAYAASNLPEFTDPAPLNEFLLGVRKAYW